MFLHSTLARRAAALLAGAVLAAGCSGTSGDTEAVAAAARAKASADWKLTLDWEGHEIDYELERLDIFIFDTDDPEAFELRGTGVTLVGTLPAEAQVGFGEDLERLVGRTVAIGTYGGDPHEPKFSTVRLVGVPVAVTGGSITFRKVTGRWAGSDGDRTVWGTVHVDVESASGIRTLEGAFAVHVVSWG